MRERGFMEARRATRDDATRPSDRIAIASVLAGGVLVFMVLLGQGVFSGIEAPSFPRLLGDSAIQAPRVASGYVPTAPKETAAPTAAPTAASSPTAESTVDPGGRRQVGGTDGEGVVLRASPRDDDWTPRGFMDGDWVRLIDTSGGDWALVQGDNGEQGWVPAQYLTR